MHIKGIFSLILLCLISLFKGYSQNNVWGTYCETGVSPYTSRNVFYKDGKYYAVLGLHRCSNDTINITQKPSTYYEHSIVKGDWKFTKNKKGITISMSIIINL